LDANSHEKDILFSNILKEVSSISQIIIKGSHSEHSLKGFGPYLSFADQSIKLDLSSNFIHSPFGHNFPAFLKIDLSFGEDLNLDNNDPKILAILNTLRKYFDLPQDIYLNCDILSASIDCFDDNKLCCHIESILPFSLYLSEATSNRVSYTAALKLQKLVEIAFETGFYLEGGRGNTNSHLLNELFGNAQRINDNTYKLAQLNSNDIKVLNKDGIYLDGPLVYFPLCMSVDEIKLAHKYLKDFI
jgi:hypothetical protein